MQMKGGRKKQNKTVGGDNLVEKCNGFLGVKWLLFHNKIEADDKLLINIIEAIVAAGGRETPFYEKVY